MKMTLSGTLPIGIPFRGKCYREVVVKLLTMGAECEVQETLETLGLNRENLSAKQKQQVDLVYLAAQVELMGAGAGALEARYLQDNLTVDDYVHLTWLLSELRKKRTGDLVNNPLDEIAPNV